MKSLASILVPMVMIPFVISLGEAGVYTNGSYDGGDDYSGHHVATSTNSDARLLSGVLVVEGVEDTCDADGPSSAIGCTTNVGVDCPADMTAVWSARSAATVDGQAATDNDGGVFDCSGGSGGKGGINPE